MSGSFAYHPPGGAAFKNPADNSDAAMERRPDVWEDLAPGIVYDQSRLGGAKALPNLKERET